MNTIESTRIKIGLTKPQMLGLLQVKLGRTTLFTAEDKDIDDIFLNTARDIADAYDEWVLELMEELEEAREEFGNYLTPTQAGRVLDISEFHLVSLRKRGHVRGTQMVVNRWAYTIDAIKELIRANSTTLAPSANKARGPLGNAFLRWYHRRVRRNRARLAATA